MRIESLEPRDKDPLVDTESPLGSTNRRGKGGQPLAQKPGLNSSGETFSYA